MLESWMKRTAATKNVAYRLVRRPDPSLIARAAQLAVSDLYESLPSAVRDASVMSSRMRPLALGVRIAGPAVTAQCAASDNLMMHKALQLATEGDVLVISGREPSGAQWGYLAALYAERKKLAGVVVDGSIRDVDALAQRQYPVWSTAIAPAHPEKQGAGAVNVPIQCDGVLVHPGDVICADGDGVLVIGQQDLAATIEKAELRVHRETEAVAAIESGISLFELHELEAAFAESGVREIEAHWDDDPAETPRSNHL
jgi:4-hydroxy-4-methyl-2-oxoglutarate aldolase